MVAFLISFCIAITILSWIKIKACDWQMTKEKHENLGHASLYYWIILWLDFSNITTCISFLCKIIDTIWAILSAISPNFKDSLFSFIKLFPYIKHLKSFQKPWSHFHSFVKHIYTSHQFKTYYTIYNFSKLNLTIMEIRIFLVCLMEHVYDYIIKHIHIPHTLLNSPHEQCV